MNMVYVNEYELDLDQNLYAHFIKKFIYSNVIIYYWIPITLLSVLITLIVITIIILLVNKEVLDPIQEMSRVTEFMLNREKSTQRELAIKNTYYKLNAIEQKYHRIEQAKRNKSFSKRMAMIN